MNRLLLFLFAVASPALAESLKISELPAASSVGDTDLVPIVQSGVNKRAGAGLIRALPMSKITDAGQIGKNLLALTTNGGVVFVRINADNSVTLLSASDFKTALSIAQSDVAGLVAALGGKEPAITAGTSSQYWRGDKSWQTLDKAAVDLGNVDNTSDANKPVSTAQAAAITALDSRLVAQSAFDADADAFIIRAGITDAVEKRAVNQLVLDLKSYSLWVRMIALYPFLGSTAASTAQNLVSSSYAITWHGGMVYNRHGVHGDGVDGYGDTGFAPSSGWSSNDGAIGVDVLSPEYYAVVGVSNSGTYDFGSYDATPYRAMIGARGQDSSTALLSYLNAALSTSYASNDCSGVWVTSRTGGTVNVYRNTTTIISGTSAATGRSTRPLYICALNANGTLFGMSTRVYSSAFISSANLSSTDQANLVTCLNAFKATLGRRSPSSSYTAAFVFDGDSLTSGYLATTGKDYPAVLLQQGNGWDLQRKLDVHNLGYGGSTVDNLITRYTTQACLYRFSDIKYYGGAAATNDLNNGDAATTIHPKLRTLWAMGRADGFTTIGFTVARRSDFSGSKATERATLNGLIRADYAAGLFDYLVDLDAAPQLSNPSDATIFPDGVHLSTLGASIVSSLIAKTVPWPTPRANRPGGAYASSAAQTLGLASPQFQVYTGSADVTWTLPSPASFGTPLFIVNRGTGTLTISGTIWDTSAVSSITIAPNTMRILISDGTYYNAR